MLQWLTTRLAAALLRAGAPGRPDSLDPDPDDGSSPVASPRPPEQVITHCAAYLDGRGASEVSLSGAAALARDGDGFVWVDLRDPTAEEFADVVAAFSLPELAVEDAVKAHQRPKLDTYDEVLFVVLKPVVYVDPEEVVDITEVALFVGPRFVVTVRHGEAGVLDAVRAETGGNGYPLTGPVGVLYRTADLVVDGYEAALVSIDDDVDEIESQVFADADGSGDHSERIYKLKREIAEFRRAVVPLAWALNRLVEGHVNSVKPAQRAFFRDVHDHALRAAESIDAHDRLLSDVLQADFARLAARQSQISVRQNEIAVQQNRDMRRISAWAAIGLVPTAISAIYGMNFHNMPELRWRFGYFVVLGVIALACLSLYRAFRRNDWL